MKKGYFDNAATTLSKPHGMYQYVADYMLNYGANISRGDYAMAKSAGKIVRETRDLLLDMLNAPKTKEVVFTPSATIALNTIINGQSLDKNDIVYISPFEHNAVIRTLNARIDGNGKVVTKGGQILIGGNDSYVAMCHKCWQEAINNS